MDDMTNKTVPVGPTYRYLKDGETIMSADEVLAYGKDWEPISEHMVGLDFDEVDNWPVRRKVEAAPPSPVTELEVMLYEALRAFRDGGPEGGTDFNGWHQSYEEPCRLARAALAAYEAKKDTK